MRTENASVTTVTASGKYGQPSQDPSRSASNTRAVTDPYRAAAERARSTDDHRSPGR